MNTMQWLENLIIAVLFVLFLSVSGLSQAEEMCGPEGCIAPPPPEEVPHICDGEHV